MYECPELLRVAETPLSPYSTFPSSKPIHPFLPARILPTTNNNIPIFHQTVQPSYSSYYLVLIQPPLRDSA
ncbi:hypothetical protein VTJ04DRAFT_1669 [Mycothermus thermophilus]|uniref:uncharacterized protein n=1 Tax=Humicola insolens TaxID=85995 RepID=UPI0037422936